MLMLYKRPPPAICRAKKNNLYGGMPLCNYLMDLRTKTEKKAEIFKQSTDDRDYSPHVPKGIITTATHTVTNAHKQI